MTSGGPAVRHPRLAALRGPANRRTGDVVTGLALAALVVLPGAGRTTFDTKLDLVVDPVGFLARALSVWNPQSGLGELQNQAVGYLFPIGPFFAAGQLAGVPPWLVQRSWQALLLVGAYAGARRLIGRLGVSAGWAGWLGALAYATGPRMLTTLGPLSAEALAVTMLPWILLPLVPGRTARPPWRAAARSALGVLLLGGANATVTLAVLPLPALWLATRRPGPARRRLAAWWAGLVAAACAWWFVPLTVLGRFSPPFLDHIETAETTTGGVTPLTALRGTTHWVATFSRSGEPWWPAGWDLVTEPWLVLATTGVAALGVAGLARRDLPERRPLVLSVAAGVLLLSLGADATGATALADGWRALLDGVLAPLRNVHKLDPLVRLPVAVGVAHLAHVAGAGTARAWGAAHHHPGPRVVLRSTAVLLMAGVVVAAAGPLLAGRLRPEPSWDRIPPAWRQAAAYLAERSSASGTDPARALLVPSSGFGEYTWGRTVDEPLQPLAGSAWAVRNQVPLGAVGSVRLLDAVERTLAAGRPEPGLAPLLARSGIRYLVVRNDLDWAATGSVRPAVVHAVLDASPGLRRVAAFGPDVPEPAGRAGTVTSFGTDQAYPQVEVYRVAGPVAGVRTYPADDVAVLSGGPESLLPALGQGVLDRERPVVLTGDDPPPGTGPWLLTDGLRRRDRNVGRVQGNLSATLTATEPSRLERRATDLLPFDASGRSTVAATAGVASVTASSSAGAADSLAPTRPEYQPFAAVDGDHTTAWRSSNVGSPVGEYLQVRLPAARDLTGASVVLERDLLLGPRVTALRVRTDTGERLTPVPPDGRAVLAVPPGPTRSLRVGVARADPGDGAVGIAELALPGVRPTRTLLLPDDAPPGAGRAPDAVVLADDDPLRPACVARDAARPDVVGCDPGLRQRGEELGRLDRTFDLEGPARYRLAAQVVPRGQTQLARYLDPLAGGVRARASSVLGDDLAVRAGAAVDGDPATAWVAAPGDRAPSVTLTWDEPRTLTGLQVLAARTPVAARPQRLEVTAAGRTHVVDLSAGLGRFGPVTATAATIRVVSWERAVSVDPATTLVHAVPPGMAELRLTGLTDLTYRPPLDARIGRVCGTGPTLLVDGRPVPTTVSATLGDLLAGRRLAAVPCDAVPLRLGAGRHHIVGEDNEDWWVTGAALTAQERAQPSGAPARDVRVEEWSSSVRRVRVAAGDRALLVVPESANAGWTARWRGRVLQPATVDGWQQAWVLPAGPAGDVALEFRPQRVQTGGLAAGAALALGVVLLALWPARRPVTAPPVTAGRGARLLDVAAVAVPLLLAGWVGAVALAVAVSVRSRRLAPAVGGLAAAAAGVLAALGAGGALGVGPGDLPVQLGALVALSVLAVSLVPSRFR